MRTTRRGARLLAMTFGLGMLLVGGPLSEAAPGPTTPLSTEESWSGGPITDRGNQDEPSLIKHRPIVRRQGATLDFRPLSRFLEATARAGDWSGAAVVIRNEYGVVIYEREIGALALWKPVAFPDGALSEDALLELEGRGFLERRGKARVARPARLGDLSVAMLNDGELGNGQRLSGKTVAAMRAARGPWYDLGNGFAAVLVILPGADAAILSKALDLAGAITAGESIRPEAWQVTAAPAPPPGPVPDLPTRTIVVDGLERSFLLYAPRQIKQDAPMPLVIMLHGGGRTPRQELERTRWDVTAEREGFLVAFPEGGWNDGSGRGGERDDVSFISALIDEVARRHSLDRDRVYLTGMAMGASMTFRAGYELADRIAAIAPVTGHFMLENPPPLKTPVPMLCIRGTDDMANPMLQDVVRVSGGTGIRKPLVRDSVLKWAAVLGLSPHSTLEYAGDGLFVERFGPGPRGEEVIFYIVEGMGFQWPGGEPLLPDRVGPGTDRIIANDVIWEFFSRHGRGGFSAKK